MSRELFVVGAGLLAMTVHSIDETVVFGAPSGPPWIAQIVITVLVLAACGIHLRLGRWRLLPAALVVLLGAFVVRTGWQAHLQPLLERGPEPTDPSGVLFVLGGVLLLAGGVLIVLRTSHPVLTRTALP